MNKPSTFLTGVGVGMGFSYLADRRRGRRRRALMRDQMIHALNEARHGIVTAARDTSHRAYGLAAEARSRMRTGYADDQVLEARIRARLGRLVSHPRAVHVIVHEGRAKLEGDILADEVRPLVSAVSAVKGVRGVENYLEIHESSEGVSSLQGGRPRPDQRTGLLDENWPPAMRLIATLGGGAAMVSAFRVGGPAAVGLGTVGTVMLARGLFNLAPRQLIGVGADDNAVQLHKTITIRAPIAEVYGFFTRFELYPRCMEYVRRVERTGEDRWRWTFGLQGGVSLSSEAIVTEQIENERMSWQSTGNTLLRESGTIHFQPADDGNGTRVDIRVHYTPPAGALGHGIATLLGMGPKQVFEDDLVRVKSLLENGKTTAHGREVTREDVMGD